MVNHKPGPRERVFRKLVGGLSFLELRLLREAIEAEEEAREGVD